MTAVEMGSLFDLLQDKFNEPYFIDSEKSTLLDVAQRNIVTKIVGDIMKSSKSAEESHKAANDIITILAVDNSPRVDSGNVSAIVSGRSVCSGILEAWQLIAKIVSIIISFFIVDL